MSQRTITRADLCDALMRKTGASRLQVGVFLQALLDELEVAVARGEVVKIARFGNFQVRSKKQRVGRNPKTGQQVPITPRRVVTFRPSQVLRQRINRKPEPPQRAP